MTPGPRTARRPGGPGRPARGQSATAAARFRRDQFRRRVLALIRRIPRGRVATYGQIAALAGYPRNARRVGRALASLPPGSGVPWQRVINAQGRISRRAPSPERAIGSPELAQEALLRREGVRLTQGGQVNLDRYRWRPRGWGGA